LEKLNHTDGKSLYGLEWRMYRTLFNNAVPTAERELIREVASSMIFGKSEKADIGIVAYFKAFAYSGCGFEPGSAGNLLGFTTNKYSRPLRDCSRPTWV
jgi:hypothetical protein